MQSQGMINPHTLWLNSVHFSRTDELFSFLLPNLAQVTKYFYFIHCFSVSVPPLTTLNSPQAAAGEAAVQIHVHVSPAGVHGRRVAQDGSEGGGSDPLDPPLQHLPHHVHPRPLVPVRAAADGHTGQRRARDALHLEESRRERRLDFSGLGVDATVEKVL